MERVYPGQKPLFFRGYLIKGFLVKVLCNGSHPSIASSSSRYIDRQLMLVPDVLWYLRCKQ